jgi:hypothetical protein
VNYVAPYPKCSVAFEKDILHSCLPYWGVVLEIDHMIQSTSIDIGQKCHPNMEYDQPTPPIWVVDSPSLHDFLDFKFPSDEAILEIMDFIDNPKKYVKHRSSILSDSKPMRVNMMICDPGMGDIDLFMPWIYCSKISFKFSSLNQTEYQCFIHHLCLDGNHQGAIITCETTHNEYFCM